MSYTNIVLFCCCCKEKFVVFVFHMKLERCVFFFLFLFFLRIFENRLLMILFCNVQRTKLFVDSGVNLGGNDSLFSTGGKDSAHNVPAIFGSGITFISNFAIWNL